MFIDQLEDLKEYAKQAVLLKKLKAQNDMERSLADELARYIERFQPTIEPSASPSPHAIQNDSADI